MSKKYVEEMCSKSVIPGTDLAFHLSYNKEKNKSRRIKIGINPSGLMCKKKADNSEFNSIVNDFDNNGYRKGGCFPDNLYVSGYHNIREMSGQKIRTITNKVLAAGIVMKQEIK